MPCRQVEDFSKKIASDFASACRTDEDSEDCFGTAYNYGRDHVTRLMHDIIRLQRESGLSRKEIVESIKDLASQMNALSYIFLLRPMLPRKPWIMIDREDAPAHNESAEDPACYAPRGDFLIVLLRKRFPSRGDGSLRGRSL